MKKITLLLAAICTCNLALAQGRWELLAEDARAIVEADTETKDYDAVWIKQTSKEEPTYALYDYRFDCGARTVGYNLVRVYKNNGKSVETFAGPSNRLGGIYMGRPTPDSMEEYVLRYVCDRQTTYSRNTAEPKKKENSSPSSSTNPSTKSQNRKQKTSSSTCLRKNGTEKGESRSYDEMYNHLVTAPFSIGIFH